MAVSMDENGGAFNSWMIVMFPGVSHSLHGFLGVTYLTYHGTDPRDTTRRQNLVASQGHGKGEGHVETILLNQTAEVLTESAEKKTFIFTKPTKERKRQPDMLRRADVSIDNIFVDELFY